MPAIDKDTKTFWLPEKRKKYENIMIFLIRQIEKIDAEIYQISGKHIVRYIEKRLKTEESINEKIRRKYKNLEKYETEKVLNDLAGVRVICFDTRQVYMLVNEIKKSKDFDVIKEIIKTLLLLIILDLL